MKLQVLSAITISIVYAAEPLDNDNYNYNNYGSNSSISTSVLSVNSNVLPAEPATTEYHGERSFSSASVLTMDSNVSPAEPETNEYHNYGESSFLSTSVLTSNLNEVLTDSVDQDNSKGSTKSSKYISKSSSGLNHLNNLDLSLLTYIGEYLTCPQKSLGFMNKYLWNIFFRERPYRFFLAQRLNFPPFLASNSDAGLIHFEKLSFVKNPVNRYFAIMNLFKNHDNIFRENSKLVAAYAGTLHQYFTPRAPVDGNSTSDNDNKNYFHLIQMISNDYFKVLKDLQNFDAIIEYIRLFPQVCRRIVIFTSEDINFGKMLMKKILNIGTDQPFIIDLARQNDRSSSYEVYFRMLNLFSTEGTNDYTGYIIISIVCNVPMEWYINQILSFTVGTRKMLLLDLFGYAKIFESPEDTLRTYDTVNRILNAITFEDQREHRYYSLLNSIRFGDFNDFDEYFRICTEESFDESMIINISKSSALAKKHNLVVGIYLAKIPQEYRSAHVLVSLLEYPSIFDGKLLVFNVLPKSYDLIDFDYSDSMFKFDFKLKVDDESEGLPSTYQYRVPHKFGLNSNSDMTILKNIKLVLQSYLFASSDHGESSLLSIFGKLHGFPDFNILNPDFPFEASCKVMSIISESESLLNLVKNYGVTFKISVDKRNLNKLFDKSVLNLKGILREDPASILEHLISKRQFQNLEEYSGNTIPIILWCRICKISENDLITEFYSYRHALHYWLNSPQKDIIKELWSSHPYFLENLILEVDDDDKRFLLTKNTHDPSGKQPIFI